MNKQHTPGPWTVTHNGYYHEIRTPWPGDSEVNKNSPSLAHIPSSSNVEGYDFDTAQANANLIASAPDLLAALEELLYGHTDKAECMANAAIAKAKGVSQ
jgi:hypothetical protein